MGVARVCCSIELRTRGKREYERTIKQTCHAADSDVYRSLHV